MQYRSPVSFRPFLLAVAMLTAVRAPLRGQAPAEELRSATAFYPLVGLGIGLLPATVLLAPLPWLIDAVLALAVWTVAAGARPLSGWAHCCDAAFAPPLDDEAATRRRRLEVLDDPRVGAMGAAGVALLLLAKWSALVYAPPLAPLVAAPVARWTVVHALRAHPAARPDGLTATLAGEARLWTATAVLMAIVLPLVANTDFPFHVAAGVIAGAVAALAVAWFLARRLGGMTGRACAAAGAAAELAALWAFLPWGLG